MTEEYTYVIPEDSDTFLADVLPTSNPLRITWEVLPPEEKIGYLSSGLRKLEEMHFIGERVNYYQPLKFPRIARGMPVNFNDIPIEVKRAQVLLAVDIMREELYVKRRNNEACIALGLVKEDTVCKDITDKVNMLLHRWITNWRKV